MRSIWASGGSVQMIDISGLSREEAKLAEGAAIDAIGKRRHRHFAALMLRFWLQPLAICQTKCAASPT